MTVADHLRILSALKHLVADFRAVYADADSLQSVKDAKEVLTVNGISFEPRGQGGSGA